MDDYGTTNPLQTSTASVYKMTACYFRLMNMPQHMLSTNDHTFLVFLAYAADMAMNFHELLRKTLIKELLELEQEGITFVQAGKEIRLPVVLFNLAGDNLGLNQLCGYRMWFRGDNACRICNLSYDEISTTSVMPVDRIKTNEDYMAAIFSDDDDVMKAANLAVNSSFNALGHFKIQDNPSVDVMHDLHQGHLRCLIPLVWLSFPNYDRVYYAVKSFPYAGHHKNNPPRAVERKYVTETLTGMTAAAIGNLISLTPLMLADLNPADNNIPWKCLLKFQKILDILLAFDITEFMLQELETSIQEYLSAYIAYGGKMTIKPHYLLHYPQMIRQYGPLRHSWSMRYEGKHQPFKQYSAVNRCVKNLPYTLAWKHQASVCKILQSMKNGENLLYNDFLIYY